MKIAKETWIIMAIGLADLTTTILFIQHHGAQEANPIFKRYWEMGLTAFIGAKMILLLGPLSILEWARHHRPRFVSFALRGAIVAYVVMYGVGYVKLNAPSNEQVDLSDLSSPSIVLAPRLPRNVRMPLHTVKQASAFVRPESAADTVTVY